MAHNKTLAAQLYAEMREFFPENAVEYFVSYYDYYQPEAKVPMHTLSNYGAVLTEAEKIGYITPDLKPLLDEWRKDPAHWRQ